MAEYITIDSVIKQITADWDPTNAGYPINLTLDQIKESLKVIAPADVAPVVHAYWANLGGGEWECSACGEGVYTEGSWETPLERRRFRCSNCGAIMDEEVP